MDWSSHFIQLWIELKIQRENSLMGLASFTAPTVNGLLLFQPPPFSLGASLEGGLIFHLSYHCEADIPSAKWICWTIEQKGLEILNSSSYSIFMGRSENNHNSTSNGLSRMLLFTSISTRIKIRFLWVCLFGVLEMEARALYRLGKYILPLSEPLPSPNSGFILFYFFVTLGTTSMTLCMSGMCSIMEPHCLT